MSSVDDRVVGMRFNNSAFERGVRTTIGTLDKLKQSLDFGKSTQSMNDLERAAGRFHMGGMGTTISGISGKLLALGTVGVTAIANITNRAVDAGIQLGKSLTIDPILQGFHEYETTLGSIQTILANTGLEGQQGLDKVNTALSQLNTYSDKTIYNFSEMARNIGTFTAAGIELDTSVSAIKGIANLAAISGSNSQQASTAMYQLSQALASGTVKLMDWNSVVNAGMGGKVFQEALFNMGKQLGTLEDVPLDQTFDQWKDAGNTFRDSLQDGWITADVLTNTLKAFTLEAGESFSKAQVAQLKAMHFSDEQIAKMEHQAQVATDAATKVKTITQLMDTLKEAVGSGWGRTFTTVFGNFSEAKELWTSVSDAVGGLIQKSAKARNKLLSDWKELGGRTVLIDAIWQAFHNLGQVVKVIKDAFHDIFPPMTADRLMSMTQSFADLINRMKLGDATVENLRRTFRGVFAVFDILGQVIKGVVSVFTTLFGTLGGGSGQFLNFTGNIGDMLVAFDKALKKGDRLENFFSGVASFLAVPMKILGALKDLIFGLFDGFDQQNASAVEQGIDGVSHALDGMSGAGDKVKAAWDKVIAVFESIKKRLEPVFGGLGNFFSGFGDTLTRAMSSNNFDEVLRLLNTVLLGGITYTLRKFLHGGFGVDIGNGFLAKLGESFGELSDTLKAMQTELKAKALLEIAAAVGILTASVIVLASMNPKELEAGVKGLALIFIELLGALAILTKVTTMTIKLPVMASALVLVAAAVGLLVLAVKSLAKMDWENLKHGLTGLGIILLELSVASAIISKSGGMMLRTGIAIVAFAGAIKILAGAVTTFSLLDWGDMVKGLTGVAGAMLAIAGGMKLMPPGMLLQGAGLLLVAEGVKAISEALLKITKLSSDELTFGLIGIGTSLATIAGAMRLMPPEGMIAQAAALLVVSFALRNIAKVVVKMAALGWKEMAQGLAALGGALAILAGAMKLMTGSIRGALALEIVSIALLTIVPALKSLGRMSWEQIIKGLVGLAGAFAVIGLAGLALSPIVGPLAAVGAALLLFGAAVTLVGAGVYLLGKGFGYLAEHGANGISTLLEALDGFISRLPQILSGLATGLVQFVMIIGKNAPSMIGAMGKILESIFQAIIKALPKALELFIKLVDTFLDAVLIEAPKIVDAGLTLVVKLLKGVAQKIPDVVSAAIDVVVAFLGAIGDQLPRMIMAGFKMVVKVLNGIADAIDENEDDIIEAGFRIGWAIMMGIPKGLAHALGDAWKWIKDKLGDLWDKFLGWFGIHSPSTKAMEIGKAIVEGIWEGLKNAMGWLWDKLSGILGDIWDRVTGFLSDIASGPFSDSGFADEYFRLHPDQKPPSSPPPPSSRPPRRPPNDGSGGGMIIKPQAQQAREVSATLRVADRTQATAVAGSASTVHQVQYTQNNYSPKPLSSGEIYRQTNRQLALIKEAT